MKSRDFLLHSLFEQNLWISLYEFQRIPNYPIWEFLKKVWNLWISGFPILWISSYRLWSTSSLWSMQNWVSHTGQVVITFFSQISKLHFGLESWTSLMIFGSFRHWQLWLTNNKKEVPSDINDNKIYMWQKEKAPNYSGTKNSYHPKISKNDFLKSFMMFL